MEHTNWDKIETIIDEALKLPASRRETYIEQECGDNPVLKSEVTLMLESIFQSEGWLENPGDYKEIFVEDISNDLDQLTSQRELIGVEVGSYSVKEKLGEGGMGAVYLAERSDGAFEHRVALKVIRRGSATQSNIQRFEQERNILASLSHPGIARLFDGGITEDGFPYLIMEYIDGRPIDEYCKEERLSLNERIDLFKNVLKAVRHAHENLIVHRDLKPANILVTKKRQVKILDFGISKILEPNPSAPLTQNRARLLTPRYAAPEQVRQQPVTTSTDLYALGVIFYRLLAEVHPFDFSNISQYETEQKILNEEPEAPSSKVQSSSPVLAHKLRGDLDAIALKAIRKETNQRYRVANEFLDDLQRYQQNLPVSACRDSAKYRSRKFLKRHKSAIGIAAGIVIMIISFATFYTWQITQERNQARIEAEKAKEISSFLTEIFQTRNPMYEPGGTPSAVTLLEGGENRIQELEQQPAVQAQLLNVIGRAYQSLGQFQKAESLLVKSLEIRKEIYPPTHPELGTGFSSLASLFGKTGNFSKAGSLHSKALNIRRASLGNSHLLTAESLNNLGVVNTNVGKYETADSTFQEALTIYRRTTGNNEEKIARVLSNRGSIYRELGNYGKAETLFREALEIWKDTHGDIHPSTAEGYNDLALVHNHMGNIKTADSLYQKALAIKKELYPASHPSISHTLDNIGVMYGKEGDLEKAENYLLKALEMRRKILADDAPKLAASFNNVGRLYKEMGNYKQAEHYLNKALEIDKKIYGPDHPYVGGDLKNLGHVFKSLDDLETSKNYFNRALTIFQEVLPPSHRYITETQFSLGDILIKLHKPADARAVLESLLNTQQENLPEGHVETARTKLLLGIIYSELDLHKDARIFLRESYKILKVQKEEPLPYLQQARKYLNNLKG